MNPLIACSVLFLLPGVFIGTVSPYVIRLAATKLHTVGSTAGTLYAVSTAGSIFGTLLTAFYLIPVLGVSNIIHSLGITLVCLSLVVVPLIRLQRMSPARAVAAVSVALRIDQHGWAPVAWAKTILQKDTFYHRIRIEEDDEARYMYFDRTLQSAMNLERPDGAPAHLFTLHLDRIDVPSRRQEDADHRPRRRLDSEKAQQRISQPGNRRASSSIRK